MKHIILMLSLVACVSTKQTEWPVLADAQLNSACLVEGVQGGVPLVPSYIFCKCLHEGMKKNGVSVIDNMPANMAIIIEHLKSQAGIRLKQECAEFTKRNIPATPRPTPDA